MLLFEYRKLCLNVCSASCLKARPIFLNIKGGTYNTNFNPHLFHKRLNEINKEIENLLCLLENKEYDLFCNLLVDKYTYINIRIIFGLDRVNKCVGSHRLIKRTISDKDNIYQRLLLIHILLNFFNNNLNL